MFTMHYNTTYPNHCSIVEEIENDDITLSELFAYFVEMTRKMGFHMGSWEHVIKEISECDENFPIDYWASDMMIEHAMREKDEF